MTSGITQYKTIVACSSDGQDKVKYEKKEQTKDSPRQARALAMRRKGQKGAKDNANAEDSDDNRNVGDKRKTLDPGPLHINLDKSNQTSDQIHFVSSNPIGTPEDYQEIDFEVGEKGRDRQKQGLDTIDARQKQPTNDTKTETKLSEDKQELTDPSALYAVVDKKKYPPSGAAAKTRKDEANSKPRPPPGTQGLEYAEIQFEDDEEGVSRPIIRQETMVDYVEINDVMLPQTHTGSDEEDPMYDNLNYNGEEEGPVMPPPRPPRDSAPEHLTGKARMPSFDKDDQPTENIAPAMAEESFSSLPDIPPVPSSQPPPLPQGVVKQKEDPPQGLAAVCALANYKPKEKKEGLLKFKKGDTALVLRKDDSGWWCVQLGKKTGWVPAEYWQYYSSPKTGDKSTHHTPACLVKEPWFMGKMSREDCEKLMIEEAKKRDFIVRESHKGDGIYALSVLYEKKVRHFPIENTDKGFRIGGFDFKDIQKVVKYYQKHPLFIDNDKGIKLGQPFKKK